MTTIGIAKNLFFIFASITVSNVWAHPGEKLLAAQWHNFKVTHGKQYENVEEERLRMKIFGENVKKIYQHNALHEEGLEAYTMGINQFGDMTEDEFMAYLNKDTMEDISFEDSIINTHNTTQDLTLPDSFDWRDHGVVTKVKDQRECRSCWAFSAVGGLESAYAIKTGQLVDLSEQDLVDCSSEAFNNGCNGGNAYDAFRHIQKYGINREADYPYVGRDGPCRHDPSKKLLRISAPVDIRTNSEDHLARILIGIGPISLSIHTKQSIQFYKDGVFLNRDCDGPDGKYPTHAVLAVGIGTSHEGQYWILKNSWGPDWGDSGYMLLPRNRNNYCGLLTRPYYPVL